MKKYLLFLLACGFLMPCRAQTDKPENSINPKIDSVLIIGEYFDNECVIQKTRQKYLKDFYALDDVVILSKRSVCDSLYNILTNLSVADSVEYNPLDWHYDIHKSRSGFYVLQADDVIDVRCFMVIFQGKRKIPIWADKFKCDIQGKIYKTSYQLTFFFYKYYLNDEEAGKEEVRHLKIYRDKLTSAD